MCVEGPASTVFTARLQVGRRLRNPLLAAAVVLRNVALGLATASWWSDLLAPAWVVIGRSDTGAEVARLFAGRKAGAGEELLARVEQTIRVLSAEDFLRYWHLNKP